LFPDDFLRVIPLHDHRRLDLLLSQRDELVNQLTKLRLSRRSAFRWGGAS
jgi:hypothetical protein